METVTALLRLAINSKSEARDFLDRPRFFLDSYIADSFFATALATMA